MSQRQRVNPDAGPFDEEAFDDDEGVVEYRVVLKVTAAEKLEAVEARRDRFVLRARIAALIGNPHPPTAGVPAGLHGPLQAALSRLPDPIFD